MEDYSEINKKVYADLALEYEKNFEKYKESDEILLKPFIDLLKLKNKDIKLLEIGPGSGLDLFIFEKNGIKTNAIDISPEIIKIAKKYSPKTIFVEENFLSYNFENEKFDAISAKALIHLFPKEDALKVIKKIGFLLNNDGIAYISTTIHEKSEEGLFPKEDYSKKPIRFRRRWTEDELIKEITNSGFKIIEKYYYKESEKEKNWINLIIEPN